MNEFIDKENPVAGPVVDFYSGVDMWRILLKPDCETTVRQDRYL
jgi:hypothetical protein